MCPSFRDGINMNRALEKSVQAGRNKRLLILLLVCAYLLMYAWTYRKMISPIWSYMGFIYEPPSWWGTLIGWAGSLIPVFWMPLALRRPSQAIYWLLYLTVYIPSMVTPYYLGLQSLSELSLVSVYLFLGFAIVNLSFRIPLPSKLTTELRPKDFWLTFWLLYATLTAIFLYTFGGSLRLVSFADRYDLRFASRLVETNQIAEYSRSWLAFCMNPILLGVGWLQRRPLLFMIGAAGEILMYSSAAARVWVVGILYIPIFYLALGGRFGSSMSFGLRILGLTCLGFALSIGLYLTHSPFQLKVAESFVARIHVVPGVFTGWYSKFFSENPITYGSQITGVNMVVKYPYSLPLEYTMGEFIMGNPEASANANIWADGIASFGPAGILAVSILLAGVFFLIDFSCQHMAPAKSSLILGIHFLNLANTGLHTSLLGGGLATSMVLMTLMPASILQYRKSKTRRSGSVTVRYARNYAHEALR